MPRPVRRARGFLFMGRWVVTRMELRPNGWWHMLVGRIERESGGSR